MRQPDILLYMSDQHAAWYMGHEGGMVDTPNMDKLASEGIRFANHYTACPLCVPARMSMLSGQLPTKIGVTRNQHTLAETDPTFLFPLVEAGYETVLIGRMHFMGKDLRHGFTKRIGGDMTPTSWNPPMAQIRAERGELGNTFSGRGCLSVIRGGESPVRSFDRETVDLALAYLAQPHEKPQFIVVGTFGPHYPYVAEPELYEKYRKRRYLPDDFGSTPDFVAENPWLKTHQKQVNKETAIDATAAYCALVEETDRHVGTVRAAFEAYGAKMGRTTVFGYLSDHGDTVGARNMYGKETFFEDSARVPFLLAGDGIPAGNTVTENTSLMDIGPTVCALAGTCYEGSFVDGRDLSGTMYQRESLRDRPVISQIIESRGGASIWEGKQSGKKPESEALAYGAMVRKGKWKYIFYHDQKKAVLFDMEADPRETVNVCERYPETARELHRILMEIGNPGKILQEHKDRMTMNRWLRKYEQVTGELIDERWKYCGR